MAVEFSLPSALSHFDPTELFDALSTGIIVLDAQLCPIYANVAAQNLLAFSLNQARGRPFGDFLHDTNGLLGILRRSLETGQGISDRELTVRPVGARAKRACSMSPSRRSKARSPARICCSNSPTTRSASRISRENDLLARLDSSRLMIRQLAHEIKNPLGGLRGAAQLLDRELADQRLKEYTGVIISEADRLAALVDSMAGPSARRRRRRR